MKIHLKKEIIIFFLFGILIAAFYGNTLVNGFIHDDVGQIVKNEYVHSLRYLPKVITGCTWEYVFNGNCKDSSYYRPFQSLSYLLTYQVSSSPWFFHLVNLAYYWIVVSLIFVLIRKITKNIYVSFLGALIFLIHPLNSEVVNWAATVPELLCAIFVLLSTIYFLNFRQTQKRKDFFLCSIFYAFGILSKEPAILLPVIFLLFDWQIYKIRLLSYCPEEEKEEDFFDFGVSFNFKEIRYYLIFLGISLLYVLGRILVLGSLTGTKLVFHGEFSLFERIYTFILLFGQYLQKFIFPYPLLFFYPFTKEVNLGFTLPFLLTISFILLAVILFKKKKVYEIIFFLWIPVFLFFVLVFVYSAGENIFSERYAFIPLIGFSFLTAELFFELWKTKKLRTFLMILAVVVFGVSFGVVFNRNKDFRDDETIYRVTLNLNPEAYSIRRNLAVVLAEKGDYLGAKEELMRIPTTWWDIDKVYNQLGECYRNEGDFKAAVSFYQKSVIASKGSNYRPFNNLAAIYFEKGEYLNSAFYLCQAVSLESEAEELRNNFNRIVRLFETIKTPSSIMGLRKDLESQKVFKEAETEEISYEGNSCDEQNCIYVFHFKKQETILPFLIAVSADSEGVVISHKSFDPQKQLVGLEISKEYAKKDMEFIFPTCSGVYYLLSVNSDEKG